MKSSAPFFAPLCWSEKIMKRSLLLSKGISGPFFFSPASTDWCRSVKDLKTLARSGLEENLSAAHTMGWNNNFRSHKLMIVGIDGGYGAPGTFFMGRFRP